MDLPEKIDIYQSLANTIKELNFNGFKTFFLQDVIDLNKNFNNNDNSPKNLIGYLSVMLRAKNKPHHIQSLFVEFLWKSYNLNDSRAKKLKSMSLDLLPLLFLREKDENEFKKQASLYFKLLDKESHDVFIAKTFDFMGLFQNPLFSDSEFIISLLKTRKNAFNVLKHLKVREQCYYQKNIVLDVVNFLIENESCNISIESIYSACNNLTLRSVCHHSGELEISWCEYSPKDLQESLSKLLMLKLGLNYSYKKFIPLIVASKHYRDFKNKEDSMLSRYKNFLYNVIAEYDNDYSIDKKDLFASFKNINIPKDLYYSFELNYLINNAIKSNENDKEINTENFNKL